MNTTELFKRPSIIGIVANVNEGKSNLIYYMLSELQRTGTFKLYTYGLRLHFKGSIEINSVEELEQIKNSVVIVDEFFNLFDLDNRKVKGQIENTLRLIHHNNNILVLAGVGENFKKFISSKLNIIIYKKVTFADLINGSAVKNKIMNCQRQEKGATLLNLEVNEAIIFDGLHYYKINVPYLAQFDTKKNNQVIVKCSATAEPKNVQKNVSGNAEIKNEKVR